MTRRSRLILLIALAGLAGLQLEAATTIKIASLAPDRSPWHKTLVDIALAWEKISEGSVRVTIYPGGILGNELDMIRKIRIGTLQGGAFTNMGINQIERSVLAFNKPFFFKSQEEFDYVFDKTRSRLEEQIENRGFKVIIWTLAGWTYFFTKEPAIYPDDLKQFKISVTPGDPELEQVWKKMGYQVVPIDLKESIIAIQSGMVTATYMPMLVAASTQCFALAPHLLNLKLSPLIGSLLLSDKTWKSIPEKYREPMMESARNASINLYQETMRLEKEALDAMIENGLKVHEAPPDALEKWREVSTLAFEDLVGKAFSSDLLDELTAYVHEFRKKSGG
jgi:TRAP-type C4-dicarboxylate transport system substrate-binding protein